MRVRPDGSAGVICGIRFHHDPMHASKAVDQEMIRPLGADVYQQFLADPFEVGLLAGFKRRLIALGGVEDDARGL